jgi:hypothetical protein
MALTKAWMPGLWTVTLEVAGVAAPVAEDFAVASVAEVAAAGVEAVVNVGEKMLVAAGVVELAAVLPPPLRL